MSRQDRPGPTAHELARRWQELAERRRRHLLEMYRTGRWRRYYNEEQMTAQMRDAVRGAERWGVAADKPAAQDRRPPFPEAAE